MTPPGKTMTPRGKTMTPPRIGRNPSRKDRDPSRGCASPRRGSHGASSYTCGSFLPICLVPTHSGCSYRYQLFLRLYG